MKIILAPDSFKGSLTQQQVIEGDGKSGRKAFSGMWDTPFSHRRRRRGHGGGPSGSVRRRGPVRKDKGFPRRDVTAKCGILNGNTASLGVEFLDAGGRELACKGQTF